MGRPSRRRNFDSKRAPDGVKQGPVRTCISCGLKGGKEFFFRLALDELGRVVKDERGTKPGRGAYVCRETPCMERMAKGRLERAFRRRVLQEGKEDRERSRGS